MKNKFMTKALAVVLSASMALSLSSATALTANGAAAPKLTKKSVSIEIGKKAKNKLAKASFKAGWRITKASVKKTAVAKAKVKKNKKVVVVTGVTAGSTKAVLKLKNAKTAATKKLTFKVKVKKAPTPVEPTVEVAANIVSAKQTKNNEVEITLDKELEAVPTADVLRIYLDGADFAPTAINFGADKKTLVVNFDFAGSTEGKTYTYEFKAADGSIGGSASITTASYNVAKIVAETAQEVPAGKLSTVKFTLESAAGIDVTSAADNLSYTTVAFEGDEARAIPNSTNPQVLLSAIGDKTKMTITYTRDTTVEPVVVEVTAVAATATEATAYKFNRHAKNAWLYSEELKGAEVYVDQSGSFNFWAKTDDAASALGYSAVKYDAIEVTSSSDDILTVSDEKVGKYDKVSFDGVKTGSATITLKCTEYVGDQELVSTYTVPVTVKAKNDDLASFSTDKGSVSMTNAIDKDYSEKVTLYALNSSDQAVDATFSIEILDSKGNATDAIKVTDPGASEWASYKAGKDIYITTKNGAPKGTYSVKISCDGTTAGGQESITKTRTITVRIDDVLEVVTSDTASYSVEITASEASLFIKDNESKVASNIGMTVKVGGKFAGYLRNNGTPKAPVYAVGHYDYSVTGKVKSTDTVATTCDASEFIARKAELTTLKFYVQDKSQAFVHESTNAAVTSNRVLYLGGEKVKAADLKAVSENYVNPAVKNKNLFTLSIYSDEHTTNADVFFFGASSAKNEGIATAGSYTVVAYNAALDDGAKIKNSTTDKQVGNKKSVALSYSITAPVITYSTSESADKFADPSTWLVLGDANNDTLRFAVKQSKDDKGDYANKYAAAKTAVEKKGIVFEAANWLKYNSNNYSAGNKVYATAVPVKVGGVTWDANSGFDINYVVENEKTIGA